MHNIIVFKIVQNQKKGSLTKCNFKQITFFEFIVKFIKALKKTFKINIIIFQG